MLELISAGLLILFATSIAFVSGAYVGHKGTIEYLKIRQELPDNWPEYYDDFEGQQVAEADCEHCGAKDYLIPCTIKGTAYQLCDVCMNILNAKPSTE